MIKIGNKTHRSSKCRKQLSILFLASFMTASVCAEENYRDARQLFSNEQITLTLTASYTYWRCFLEAGFIATSKGADASETTENSQPSYAPSFNYQSGFKVGGGIYTKNSYNFMVNYTWFYNHPGLKETDLTNDSPEDDFLNYEEGKDLSFLESQFTNTFNRIDGYFEREFTSGKSLSLSPQMGILGAWETSHLNYNYRESTLIFDGITRFKQNWWGIGPYIGAEVDCYFYKRIVGMFIRPAGALLLTDHKVTQTSNVYDDEGDLVRTPINVVYNFYSIEPMLDTTIGAVVQYEEKSWMVRADIGWQAQTYFYHNGFVSFNTSNLQRGNYSMQGLIASVTVGF